MPESKKQPQKEEPIVQKLAEAATLAHRANWTLRQSVDHANQAMRIAMGTAE
jgi:hypothetical protein